MGDISVIARRRSDGMVEFGWGGNGGYFGTVGLRLLKWYNDPEMVNYLFGMGEMRFIYKPYSENGDGWLKNTPAGSPHEISETEKAIFSTIAFVDYGYFYDSDGVWYYIVPGPFRIKIPLFHICAYMIKHDEADYEFDYLREIEKNPLKYIFTDYLAEDPDFRKHLKKLGINDVSQLCKELSNEGSPIYAFRENNYNIFEYFDDWVKVMTTDDFCEMTGFILKRRAEKHIETIYWEQSEAAVHSLEELRDAIDERENQEYKELLYRILRLLMQEKLISAPEEFMEQIGRSPADYQDIIQKIKEEFPEEQEG